MCTECNRIRISATKGENFPCADVFVILRSRSLFFSLSFPFSLFFFSFSLSRRIIVSLDNEKLQSLSEHTKKNNKIHKLKAVCSRWIIAKYNKLFFFLRLHFAVNLWANRIGLLAAVSYLRVLSTFFCAILTVLGLKPAPFRVFFSLVARAYFTKGWGVMT